MKTLLLTFCFCLFFTAVCEAKPLLIRWNLYAQGGTPAERLVLWRGALTGAPTPYAIITDLQATSYVDNGVKFNRTYCYHLRAVTAMDVSSAPSPRACARPNR